MNKPNLLSCLIIVIYLNISLTYAAENDPIMDLLTTINEGEWVKLNRNKFSSIWTPEGQRPKPPTIWGSPYGVINAWSSMAWDSSRGALIFWGGGHANYPGNEVYRWQGSTLEWERASLPSEISLIVSPVVSPAIYETVDGVYNAPISSHTYDNNEYLPIADRFAVFGGAAYNTGWRFEKNYPSREPTGPYFWDPAKASSGKVGGLNGSQVKPTLYPGIIGGAMWENRDNMPKGNLINGTSAYFEQDGKDVLYFQSPKMGLWKYTVNSVNDSSKDEYKQVGINWFFDGGQGAGAYDPNQKIFLRTGNVNFYYWNLNGEETFFNKSAILNVTYQDSGIGWLGGYGMDYDPVRKQYLLWNGYGAVWKLNPRNWVMKKAVSPGSSAVPNYGTGRGILGKWKYIPEYDVFFGVSDPVSGDVWAYKPENWLFYGPSIVTSSLPSGNMGTPYLQTLNATSAGALQWTISNGSLPDGLVMNGQTGVISGIPVSKGRWIFSVTVSDNTGRTSSKNFNLSTLGKRPSPIPPKSRAYPVSSQTYQM